METAPVSTVKYRLLCHDLDGTLLGKPDATLLYRRLWDGLSSTRPLQVYNTGRLLKDAWRTVLKSDLPEPDFLICGVGTLIYDSRTRRVVHEFSEIMNEGWDRDRAEQVVQQATGAVRQPAHFQNAYKSSWYLHKAPPEQIAALENLLAEAGLETMVVYSSDRDLDILPKYANKGNALAWLLKHLGIAGWEVIVSGDSGNDTAMFQVPGVRGIVVENAQPELIEGTLGLPCHRAHAICADGVIDGLVHFGVFTSASVPEEPQSDPEHKQYEPEIRQLLSEVSPEAIRPEEREYLREAYSRAVVALRKNITPRGFSACSLADNEVRGTDSNYRSVWARDGSITLIASLPLDEPDIRACQRETLRTLLSNTSPHGQIPANVNLDTGVPDFSGVGGISSIDSGLWTIIAAYEFLRVTRETALLREFLPVLKNAMTWLTAHDSNYDALLEIPEAGDWTDLFGRSYNVLVDQVIWYRANIAFGRILETLGQTRQAGEHLRWAQTIKSAILHRFWPSTAANLPQRTFADMQYSLGDASYLLAQVTPFDFNWRCDVYGNILAFLFNVLDVTRAQVAFRFMWGVGVNQPFPVANLYPVVMPGDPDWRPYYAVNLLNLPHHYHNGGIWPFIGGKWVQFISRLGMRTLALQELLKLARINQRGVQRDWEFNEWAHAQTGNPMGKAYQAWSAAEFILACHEAGLEDLPGTTL